MSDYIKPQQNELKYLVYNDMQEYLANKYGNDILVNNTNDKEIINFFSYFYYFDWFDYSEVTEFYYSLEVKEIIEENINSHPEWIVNIIELINEEFSDYLDEDGNLILEIKI